jgi:hypothetical protein
MKYAAAITLLLLSAGSAGAIPHQTGIESPAARIMHRLDLSLAGTGCLPLEPAIYAPVVTVSHNWSGPMVLTRNAFIAAFSRDMPLLTSTFGRPIVTRSFTAGSTVVITVKYPIGKATASPPLQIAFFFLVKDSRILEEEVFADRLQLKPVLDALRRHT